MNKHSNKTGVNITAALLLLPVLGWITTANAVLQPGFDQELLGDVGDTFGRNRAYGVGMADFNGDSIDDMVSGDTAGDVHYYQGVGDGTFVDNGVKINAGFHDAYGLATGDFNNDDKQDVVLSFTGGSGSALDGELHLYLGNGDGTFTGTTTIFGLPRLGILIGDAGTDPMTLVAGDIDGDGDIDLISGDRIAPDNNHADVLLFRNQLIPGGTLNFTAETIISAPGGTPDPENPPYFPPTSYLHAYGLALGDVDDDTDLDLLVGDRANYMYVYENDGFGGFSPVRYETIGTRPFAFDRLHTNFSSKMSLAAGDMNGDGVLDFASSVQTGDGGQFPGQIDLWLGVGADSSGRPDFNSAGVIGEAGNDARGLAVGQLNPANDAYVDIVFGNFEGDLWGLFADLLDSDNDDIVDRFDNAPMHYNPPVLDMNTDGGINRFDQLDNDHDGVGDPADDDDDNDTVLDVVDNCEFTPNEYQDDFDGDGRGNACDPLNDTDTDGDGITDGPMELDLVMKAVDAKATWAQSDTHIIVRIDALSRVFQNEFVQTMLDGATLTPAEWEDKKFENYNGIGDAPAEPGYQVPEDLEGGMDTPITIVVIPKLLFNAFGDPDPIEWINMRNANPNLEIAQHGTYHADNTLLGDWADQSDRNFFSCETCGFPVAAMYQYLRVGKRTLLGEYDDPWILAPTDAHYIDWTTAANPMISYAPPFNTSDTDSRDASSRLGAVGFSASTYEENSSVFTPEGSHQDDFDQFGMFHASAHLEVDPEDVALLDYIYVPGTLNTWLIEEVSWSTRYCNDLDRLEPCADAPGNINRENNMVDEVRWGQWLTLLEFANTHGVVMTLGDYALAVATDNCIGISNPDQADADADGVGDVCDIEYIDIMPGSDKNPINLKKKGVIPVEILGSDLIDVTLVDVSTLRFGPDAAAPSHDLEDPAVYALHLVDTNTDGFMDLVSHYDMQETGIASDNETACLKGQIAGTMFTACDSITTKGP